SDLTELLAMDFKKLSQYFPVMLATPEAAAELLTDASFDVLLVDDAHQLSTAHALSNVGLADRVILAGDEQRSALHPDRRFFADQLQQHRGITTLQYQHLQRPLRLLQFANVAFDQQLRFVNRGSRLFPQEGLALNTHGRYNAESQINDEECANVIGILLNVPPLPDHNVPTVSIVAFSVAQRDLIADRILELSQVKDEDGARIKELYQHGLAVYHIDDFDAIQTDVLIASLGYAPPEDSQPTEGLFDTPQDHARLRLLCSGHYHQIILCHSLPNELIQHWRQHPAQRGSYVLSHFIDYLRALETNDARLQQHVLQKLNPHPAQQQLNPFLQQVGKALEAYFEPGRIRYNLTAGNTVLPLVLMPKDESQQPWLIQADGSFAHGQIAAYEWAAKAEETIAYLGLRVKNIWSVDWWKSPQHCARVLASELIREENVVLENES
ncbi:MAG: hypothetical protein AAFO94_15250, partial [Bacteroidota bacterium]